MFAAQIYRTLAICALFYCFLGVGYAQVSIPDTVTGQDMADQVLTLAMPKDKKKSPLTWGASFETVKKKETRTLEEEIDGSLLGYRAQKGDSSIYMVYVFDAEGKLAEVDFFLNYIRSENSLYVADYTVLVANFTKAFGKAIETKIELSEGVNEEEVMANLGEAYENGEAKTVNVWNMLDDTRVVATIGGEESGISLAVMFSKKD